MTPSDIWGIFIFGIFALFLLIMGWKRGFFELPHEAKKWVVPIRWFHVVGAFAVYFTTAILIVPVLGSWLKRIFFPTPAPPDMLFFASWLNFLNSTLILSFLALFLFQFPKELWQKLWRRPSEGTRPYSDDVRFAFFGWILSFPLVLFISQVLDLFVFSFFRVSEIPEQLAVHFLKMTFDYPFYLFLTIATIAFFAPLIEELLFRGLLQTYIRQHLGSKEAIFVTSVLFAFFHYSPEQGIGNIPIIGSLFALALFLGFLYEKKGSLAAPIALHAFFNAISIINLYFLGGFPKGPL